MGDFLQTLIIAVTLGSLYALIALGYTMVYGILQLINFAHSDIVVLGAWVSFTAGLFLLPRMGIDLAQSPWWAGLGVLLLAMIVCAGVGWIIERFAYRPIRTAPRLNALITAIGVSLLLQNVGQLQWTVVPSERPVAAGNVSPGKDRTFVQLDRAVKVEPELGYQLSIQTPETPTPTVMKLKAPPGDYAAGSDIEVDRRLGKAMFREATYTLKSQSPYPPLELPFGTQPQGVPPLISSAEVYRREFTKNYRNSDGTITQIPQPVVISRVDVMIVTTAAVLMIGLQLLVYRTRFGRAMRAASYNIDTAALMGVPVDRVISITFAIGAALAAAAGFLFAMKYSQIQQPAHATWTLLGLKAFVAAVVGGIGNIRGATVGGFLIAFIEQFGGRYGQFVFENSSAYTDVYVFALLILVLLVKPSGLFGKAVKEKV